MDKEHDKPSERVVINEVILGDGPIASIKVIDKPMPSVGEHERGEPDKPSWERVASELAEENARLAGEVERLRNRMNYMQAVMLGDLGQIERSLKSIDDDQFLVNFHQALSNSPDAPDLAVKFKQGLDRLATAEARVKALEDVPVDSISREYDLRVARMVADKEDRDHDVDAIGDWLHSIDPDTQEGAE